MVQFDSLGNIHISKVGVCLSSIYHTGVCFGSYCWLHLLEVKECSLLKNDSSTITKEVLDN